MKFKIPNKENHYAMWNWLTENPKKEKKDWPGFQTIKKLTGMYILNYCFCCREYDYKSDETNCYKCPVFKLDGKVCYSFKTTYDDYNYRINKVENAKKIRDCWR